MGSAGKDARFLSKLCLSLAKMSKGDKQLLLSFCGFPKFWHVNSGNSGTVCTCRQDLLQVEMTRSSRGSVEMDKAPSFQNPIKDGCRHIIVV
jgi:hypothetical protein